MTNFGASFKKARESKGITLDQIAKETRISTRFLNAIESGDFHLLPGGIFNRGFVRTFAESVGLDPNEAVAEYERLVSVREPSDVPASETPHPSSRSERRLYPVILAILAVAIAIFYIVTRDSARPGEISKSPPAQIPESVVAPLPAVAPETTAAASPPPTTEPEPESPPSTQALTLDIEALEKTWIKVTSDGNAVLPGEVLERGMTRKFTAENSIYISVGNAAGVTLKINDMQMRPLGKSGEVRSVTITPANLKGFIG